MCRPYFLFTLIASSVVGALLLMAGPWPLWAAPLRQTGDPVIIATGDISNCSNWQDEETARLVEAIDGTVLALGDLAYEVGSVQEFNDCYGPTWGRFKGRTRPVPGNHEYGKGNASDYFTWWGDLATPLQPGCTVDCKGYYSFDIGAWHIVALNSELANQAGSEQEQWLRADLAAHPTACTLAYWHRPTFSSGSHTGGAVIDLYQALYDYGADLLLVGHDHDYERFAPHSPGGQYEPDRGLRQIVVGTGGAQLRDFRFIQPNSEARSSETFGVLKVTLHPTSYDWEFIPIPSQSFRDAGSSNCVSAGNLPVAPVVATTAPAAAPAAPAEAPTVAANTVVANNAVAAPVEVAGPLVAGLDYVVQDGDTLSAIGIRYGLDWREIATVNNLADGSIIQVGQIIRLPGVQGAANTTTATTGGALPAPTAAPTPAAQVQPVPTTAAVSSAGGRYIVKSGDTLYAIAIRNNTTWQQLAAANGLSENDIIVVGQELILPGSAGTAVTTAAPAPAGQVVATATFSLLPTPTAQPANPLQATATPLSSATSGTRTYTVAPGDTLISIAARFGLDWAQLLQLNGLTADSVIRVGQQIRLN